VGPLLRLRFFRVLELKMPFQVERSMKDAEIPMMSQAPVGCPAAAD
jgi:hypothetical protein